MIRVLVADDTSFMRTSLKFMLERNNIEVVGEADTGLKVVDMYIKLRPDVVTMDITMPSMDGIEAVKKIIKFDAKAKICMVTTLGREGFVKQAVMAGAKNFLVKPFREEKVIEVIRNLAGEKENSNASQDDME